MSVLVVQDRLSKDRVFPSIKTEAVGESLTVPTDTGTISTCGATGRPQGPAGLLDREVHVAQTARYERTNPYSGPAPCTSYGQG
jgi:hypothetical protein